MSHINRGGPVFPQPQTYGEWADGSPWFEGMTLRDYFAAKALQGLLHDASSGDGQWEFEAKAAYKIADAMLREKEKP